MSTQPKRIHPRLRAGIILFWILFAAIAIPVTGIGHWVKNGRIDLINQTIWESSWIGWGPLTLLILHVCRRYPIERYAARRTSARLAVIGVGIVVLELLIECTINTALGMWLRDYTWDWRRLLLIATYKSHAYYLVYWMIVGGAHAYEYHQRLRESELLLARAELDRLKAQLHPHFLFNALNSIVALMLKEQTATAIRMITQLSALLRASLSQSDRQLVSLREEVETLRLYLDIQQERFGSRVVMNVNVPDELLDAEFPHLLLQPLVENAVHHGLDQVKTDGRLDVTIARDGETLVCEVRDNGRGLVAKGNDTPIKPSFGIGLGTTRERLQQLYGTQHRFTIEPAGAHGCAVRIRLPLRVPETTTEPEFV